MENKCLFVETGAVRAHSKEIIHITKLFNCFVQKFPTLIYVTILLYLKQGNDCIQQ